jgi:hypothetical protein
VATPALLRVAVPSALEPYINATVPVGVMLPEEAAIVAVQVTAAPAVMLDEDKVRPVVVGMVVMFTATAEDFEAAKELPPA